MTIKLNKDFVAKRLFIIVILLLIANCISKLIQVKNYNLSENTIRVITNALDFNTESNFPTLFSSFLLLSNSIMLFIIAKNYKRNIKNYKYWLGLSIVFFFLALDEILHIHEHLVVPVRSLFNTKGLLYNAWFIPYLTIVLVLGIIYIKFFKRLPIHTLKLFIISAVIFLSGAVGMEAIGGQFGEFNDKRSLTYFVMYTIEELLEMTGSIIFLYALIDFTKTNHKPLKLKF